ncbi:methionine synthase, partial [Klebsiella pneumoniae]|nr:methionine synthase [Klebsiella pneumoniae]
VQNASRTVGVVAALLSDKQRDEFVARTRKEYEVVRDQYARRQPRSAPVTLAQARANAFAADWDNYTPPRPAFTGVKTVTAPISVLRRYIDWTPFFMTWSLAGKYPRILEDNVVGEEARRLFKEANAMLDELDRTGALTPRGVAGIFPANRIGDDIAVYRDESREEVLLYSCH